MTKKIILLAAVLASSASLAAGPKKYITYEQFGAVGDGVHDDMPAIVAAHEAANKSGKPVKATPGKCYFIDSLALTAVIMTDTYWDGAEFIINDVGAVKPNSRVFFVKPSEKSYLAKGVESLRKGQRNLGIKLPVMSLVEVANDDKRVFIRYGSNANKGSKQKEMLLVNTDGSIDRDTPVIWDYDNVTSVRVYPVDERPLTISGGTITTIANRTRGTSYYSRNLYICRSNVTLKNFTHYVKGELEYGSPYHGFINITNAADVRVENCVVTGHKRYSKTGALGKPVWMGTYDLSVSNSVRVSFRNCVQSNDIDDPEIWGIMGSNFCKALLYDGCRLSRFDAHQGCTGAVIRNSVISGISALGFGTLLLENLEVHDFRLVKIRGDYGSSWDGNIIVRNCTLKVPADAVNVDLFNGYNFRAHDFGYDCTLPHTIEINGLVIDDSEVKSEEYSGPFIFSRFDVNRKAEKLFPYPAPRKVIVKGLEIASGKELSVSLNKEMFKDTEIVIQ